MTAVHFVDTNEEPLPGTQESSDILERAWAVQESASVSWWDALIVASAQAADVEFLLTEDRPDGQLIGEIRVKNPFTASVPAA